MAMGQPGNDACAQAMTGYAIPPMGGVISGTLAGATRDAVGTTCPFNQTGVDVYHTITPMVTGVYSFETCGLTSWDTVLSLHVPPCPASAANQLAGGCNDDACGLQSRVSSLLQAGQTYILRVGAYSSATPPGPYQVAVTFTAQAANDECGSSNPVLALDTPVMGDNLGASTSVSITPATPCGNYAGSGGGADVFYQFVPATTGAFTFSTCGSAMDTVLSVHSGCPATSANTVACNDDAGTACSSSGLNSLATAMLTAGQVCFVRVAGYGDASGGARTGTFVLSVHRDSLAVTGACCDAYGASGCTVVVGGACSGSYQGDSTTCSSDPCPPPSGACCWSGGGCTMVASTDCVGTFSGAGSACSSACLGVCCIGACCVLMVADDCSSPGGGVGAVYVGGLGCNAAPVSNVPCCRADFDKSGTVTVGDIFDYLNAWFAGSPFTHLPGPGQSTVQDIFDFLSVWFAGGC
jgi:hypothetical protein